MGRNRLTIEQAQVRGADTINPGRFASRKKNPKASGSLGNPPKHLSPEIKRAWKEIANNIPSGVAGKADRHIMELAATLMHQFRSDPDMPGNRMSLLVQVLGKLGLDPQSRTRLQVEQPEEKKADPFATFMASIGAAETKMNEDTEL